MCNDIRWFADYIPFESRAGDMYTDQENVVVAGVGTVILPVKKAPSRSGKNAHGKIILRNVLHCPNALCNIFAFPGGSGTTDNGEDYDVTTVGDKKRKGAIRKKDGSPVAYFDPTGRLFQIKLSGPPYGPITGSTVLKGDGIYMINVRWPAAERERYAKHLRTIRDAITAAQPRYTDAEKEWLKGNFKNEYTFLQRYGLSIYKEEDREEGRAILRALIEDDKDTDTEVTDEYTGSDDDSDDLDGHMADYHFDEQSLDWIEKHYKNSRNFMFSFGLKFYDDDDCFEAQRIVHAMMEED